MCQGFVSDYSYSRTQTTSVFGQMLLVRDISTIFSSSVTISAKKSGKSEVRTQDHML